MIVEARRPVLYVGGGVIRAGAAAELQVLAELTGIPVVTTLMARGAFPDSHPLHLGMPGMHGTVGAVGALQKSDLLITLGARFDDRVTGKLSSFAPDAKVDPRRHRPGRDLQEPHGRRARSSVTAARSSRTSSSRCRPSSTPAARSTTRPGGASSTSCARRTRWATTPRPTARSRRSTSSSGWARSPGRTRSTAPASGQHQMWAAQFVRYEKPNSWINSGGLGTMGFAVPAAMGAKVGRPDATVWAIDGDGCFQMTNQELATCALNDIPIKVAIINNGSLGMVRQWQTLFYDSRYSNTTLHSRRIPDFVKLADAYGCVGLRCESTADVDATIDKAMSVDDRPVVVDFVVHQDAMVWPMVAAGTSNDDIMVARDLAPVWDREE